MKFEEGKIQEGKSLEKDLGNGKNREGKKIRWNSKGKSLEKDLRSRKNRELKKEKNFIKLEERKIRGGKNSKREKFGEGFKEEEKSRGEKEKILDENWGEKNLGKKDLKERKKLGTKKRKRILLNSRREKFEEEKIWRRI